MLVFIGALDDRFDISVKIRATIQAAVGIVMMVFGKLYLSSLGYIFGSWEMVLGPFGYFLTLFAVWAAVNAFNIVMALMACWAGCPASRLQQSV